MWHVQVWIPSIVFFCFLMNILYFAHSSIVGEIGFNPTLNQVLVSSSEFTPLVLLVYSQLPKKKNYHFVSAIGSSIFLDFGFREGACQLRRTMWRFLHRDGISNADKVLHSFIFLFVVRNDRRILPSKHNLACNWNFGIDF